MPSASNTHSILAETVEMELVETSSSTTLSIFDISKHTPDFSVSTIPTTTSKSSTEMSTFLPKYIYPTFYKLRLEPINFFRETNSNKPKLLKGEVSIMLDILQTTHQIYLHSYELEFSEIFLEKKSIITTNEVVNGNIYFSNSEHILYLKPKSLHYNSYHQILEIAFAQPIEPGVAQLHIKYFAKIKDAQRGVFECPFTSPQNDVINGIVTHFEPTDSRTLFPNFDEPFFKSQFQLEVVAPVDYDVISNCRAKEIVYISDSHQKVVVFYPSPKMSSYLVCFIIGKFESIERKIPVGDKLVTVKAHCPFGKSDLCTFALDVACDAIQFFSNLFGVPYMMDKMDLVAVSKLDALAMENFALCVFRLSYFLVDEKRTSLPLKQRIARLIAHEVAHQWFGNYVSISWWKDLYLKEGFARYLEYLMVTHHFPHWNYWLHFERDIYTHALEMDEDRYTHPVEVECYHASQIHSIFDSISYGKGACVIRMISEFIGHDALCEGLKQFLQKHQYSVATTEDLWKSFERVTNVNVSKVMNCWIKYSGHPVLVLSFSPNSTPEKTKLIIQQVLMKSKESIVIDKPCVGAANNAQYVVPVLLKRKTVEKPQPLVVTDTASQLTLSNFEPGEWIKFNFGHQGFYRVKYPREMWASLGHAVANDELAFEDKMGLLVDACTFVRLPTDHPAHLEIEVFLEFVMYYRSEKEHQIWFFIIQKLQDLLMLMLEDEEIAVLIQQYISTLLSEIVEYVDLISYLHRILEPNSEQNAASFNSQEQIDYENSVTSLRGELIHILLLSNESRITSVCQSIFEKLFNRGIEQVCQQIQEDCRGELLESILGAVCKHGGEQEHKKILQLYFESLRTKNLELQKICFKVLWYSNKINCIKQNISLVFNENSGMQDDYVYLIQNIISYSPMIRNILWNDLLRVAYNDIMRAYNSHYTNITELTIKDFISESHLLIDIKGYTAEDRILRSRTTRHSMFFSLLITTMSAIKQTCANQSFFVDILKGSRVFEPFLQSSALESLFNAVNDNIDWLNINIPKCKQLLQ